MRNCNELLIHLVNNTITHFEIYGKDLDKLKRFYSGLFGWNYQLAPISEEYWLIQTTQNQVKNNKVSILTGGLSNSQSIIPGIKIYITVDSLDETCAKIIDLGGKVLSQKREIFDMGWSIDVEDPEGNRFAIWQNLG
jgi:predicted enzyme related to lactoylglutathione lyase